MSYDIMQCQLAPSDSTVRYDDALKNALLEFEELSHFLTTAPMDWQEDQVIRRFYLNETLGFISCIFWNNLYYITGTDIVKICLYKMNIFGREITQKKKFEEGIFSDLRNLKCDVDATLEHPKSRFLSFLYRNNCLKTQKKQKVFYWFSVMHERLFVDALDRDLKREERGQSVTTTAISEPALTFRFDSVTNIPFNEQLRKHLSSSVSAGHETASKNDVIAYQNMKNNLSIIKSEPDTTSLDEAVGFETSKLSQDFKQPCIDDANVRTTEIEDQNIGTSVFTDHLQKDNVEPLPVLLTEASNHFDDASALNSSTANFSLNPVIDTITRDKIGIDYTKDSNDNALDDMTLDYFPITVEYPDLKNIPEEPHTQVLKSVIGKTPIMPDLMFDDIFAAPSSIPQYPLPTNYSQHTLHPYRVNRKKTGKGNVNHDNSSSECPENQWEFKDTSKIFQRSNKVHTSKLKKKHKHSTSVRSHPNHTSFSKSSQPSKVLPYEISDLPMAACSEDRYTRMPSDPFYSVINDGLPIHDVFCNDTTPDSQFWNMPSASFKPNMQMFYPYPLPSAHQSTPLSSVNPYMMTATSNSINPPYPYRTTPTGTKIHAYRNRSSLQAPHNHKRRKMDHRLDNYYANSHTTENSTKKLQPKFVEE